MYNPTGYYNRYSDFQPVTASNSFIDNSTILRQNNWRSNRGLGDLATSNVSGFVQPARRSNDSYIQTSTVLKREVPSRHYYDFLDRSKVGRFNNSDLASRLLEKDAYYSSLRPNTFQTTSYNTYVCPPGNLLEASTTSNSYRLEALRQRLLNERNAELDSQRLRASKTLAAYQTEMLLSRTPSDSYRETFGPLPTTPTGRSVSERRIKTTPSSPLRSNTPEFILSPKHSIQRSLLEGSQITETEFQFNEPLNDQGQLRRSNAQFEDHSRKHFVVHSPTPAYTPPSAKQSFLKRPDCSFQNFDEIVSERPQRNSYSDRNHCQVPLGSVRGQSPGIVCMRRTEEPEVRRSVTRIESKTYIGDPRPIPPQPESISRYKSGIIQTPIQAQAQVPRWLPTEPCQSSYTMPSVQSESRFKVQLAEQVQAMDPNYRVNLPSLVISQTEDDLNSSRIKSPVRSILKRSNTQSKNKRVTVDENRNEVKEFEKYSPRRISVNFPADAASVRVESPDHKGMFKTLTNYSQRPSFQASSQHPSLQASSQRPSFQNYSQPFQVLSTNAPRQTAEFPGPASPRIRNQTRVAI